MRDALAQLFVQAKVDYSIASDIDGHVTIKLTAQPLDNALRLLMRVSGDLTYEKVSGTYVVRRREIETPSAVAAPTMSAMPATVSAADKQWDTIQLIYVDPYDVRELLHILIIPTFSRQGAGSGGLAGGQRSTGPNAGTPSTAQTGGGPSLSTVPPSLSY